MTYTDFNKWAQTEVNALPVYYAFGNKQFNEMLAKHFNNMTMEDAKQKLYGNGYGGYYLKTDAERINNTFENIAARKDELIKEDTSGDGFIFQMFYYELMNHEYIITADTAETLDACGITADDLETNPALKHGLNKAIKTILAEETAQ